MNALFMKQHGGLEVVEYGELPTPQAGPCQVRVRVRAAALNRLDLWVREGWPALKLSFPHVFGADIAGEIDQLGPGAQESLLGKRVVVAPGMSCERCQHCLSGNENLCRHYSLLGEHQSGGQAEYIVVPQSHVLEIPENLSFESAACLPVTYLTAWHMLTAKAPIGPNSTVLIHAAGSGVGSAAIQIAKLFGAAIITTAGSAEKCEHGLALGADHAINYRTADFAEVVQRLTDGRGVDVILDMVAGSYVKREVESLAEDGRLVIIALLGGAKAEFNAGLVLRRRLTVTGSTLRARPVAFKGAIARALLEHAWPWLEDGTVRPVLHATFDALAAGDGLPSGAARAHALMESSQHIGKIVLTWGTA